MCPRATSRPSKLAFCVGDNSIARELVQHASSQELAVVTLKVIARACNSVRRVQPLVSERARQRGGVRCTERSDGLMARRRFNTERFTSLRRVCTNLSGTREKERKKRKKDHTKGEQSTVRAVKISTATLSQIPVRGRPRFALLPCKFTQIYSVGRGALTSSVNGDRMRKSRESLIKICWDLLGIQSRSPKSAQILIKNVVSNRRF